MFSEGIIRRTNCPPLSQRWRYDPELAEVEREREREREHALRGRCSLVLFRRVRTKVTFWVEYLFQSTPRTHVEVFFLVPLISAFGSSSSSRRGKNINITV